MYLTVADRDHEIAGIRQLDRTNLVDRGNPNLISLAAGFVDPETLPIELVQLATQALLSSPASARASLQYGTTHGSLKLRRLLKQRLESRDRQTLQINDDQLVLTAGSNELLHLTCDALCDEGDIILSAAPTYLVFLGVMDSIGAVAQGVESDDEGICPDALDRALTRLESDGDLGKVRGVYLVSYFDNPGGRMAGQTRREKLWDVTARWSERMGRPLILLEDAAYRDLRFEGPDVPSLLQFDPTASRTVYLGTFSKSFSPGIRVGWGLLPHELSAAVIDLKTNTDFGSPHFSQQLIAHVLEQEWDIPHTERLCAGYRRKRDAMLAALERHFADQPGVAWRVPAGGLYVWLTLPAEMETGLGSPLWEHALSEGVIYVPGEFCHPAHGTPKSRHGMRLSYGVTTVEQIDAGIAMLARAVAQVGST